MSYTEGKHYLLDAGYANSSIVKLVHVFPLKVFCLVMNDKKESWVTMLSRLTEVPNLLNDEYAEQSCTTN